MASDIDDLCKHYQKLWSDQANWRMLWNTIAQYVMPAWDNFIGYFPEGVIRTTRIFDSTGISANERFAAAMEHLLTPRTQMWHDIKPMAEQLEDDPEVMAYCAAVRKILFRARYRPRANYAGQTGQCYLQLGAFGNHALWVDEVMGQSMLYQAIPLSELCWALDASGIVDTVYRLYELTARNCVQRWGEEACGEAIAKIAKRDPHSDVKILHCVRPNAEREGGAIGTRGMAYESTFIGYERRNAIHRGGYRTFPYAIGRYRMAPREHYGRAPGSVALPHIRTLNEQKKTALRAGQKMVDPPLLLSEEGALTPFSLRAGSLNYGALSEDGTALVQPLALKGDMPVAKELMELEANAINDHFLVSLFQILVQNPEMTATEALIRAQEKGVLIAPAMGQQQSEFLGTQVLREIDILHHARQLPQPPPQLLEAGGLRVEYTSPLSKLMRAEEAQSIATNIQGVSQFMSVRPEVGDIIDWDGSTREYLDAGGFPGKLVLPPEKVQALREQRAQQQQEQNMAAAAPGVSQSALNLAKAHQAMSGAGGGGNAQPAAG
jgi:hypothetical protein